MYWSSPRVIKGMLVAAAPNNNKGNAVTSPRPTKSEACSQPCVANVAAPDAESHRT